MKKGKIIIWIIACIVIIALIGFIAYGYYRKATMEVKNPIVTMEVENFGTVKMELYPDKAPESVANFIALINRGYYNGNKFHRIVKDFVIQAGSKDGEGQENAKLSDLKEGGEDEEYTIKGEFIANGVNNNIKFEEGVLGVARGDYSQYSSSLKEESYNSGSSQFFIVTKESSSLDGLYTPFGKVIEGMDIVHKMEEVEIKQEEESEESTSSESSTPVNPPVIKSMTVETNGIDFGLPQTLEPFDFMSWFSQNSNLSEE